MALPKSMQVLGAVSLLMFFYLITLIFRSPSQLSAPGYGGKIEEMTRDPNLDRPSPHLASVFNAIH
jgi:hypothetical protein